MDGRKECKWYMPWKSRIDTGNQKSGQEKTKKEGDGVILLFASSVAGKRQRTLLKADKSTNRGAWEVIENCEGDIIDSIWETKEKEGRTRGQETVRLEVFILGDHSILCKKK